MSEQEELPEPVTASARELKQRVSPERWAVIVTGAQARSAIVEKVQTKCTNDAVTPYQALRVVSPATPWPTFQAWSKRVREEESNSWESLVDRRVPPSPRKIPDVVRASAITLRMLKPEISHGEALERLATQHGDDGRISCTSLDRIWESAGLVTEEPEVEEVLIEEFQGGAGLALIAAAATETGAMMDLAQAVQSEARRAVSSQSDKGLSFPDEPVGRDERGRLTSEYNRSTRLGVEVGQADNRWDPDYVKQTMRDLGQLQVVEHRAHTIADKLLSVAVIALLTERRGFDGLDGPFGDWLGVLGGCPYKDSTLDKFLAQLGFLGVEDALWETHALLAKALIAKWATAEGRPPWLQFVIYIDGSQDAHWTHKYARSGKVSRTGRVGPCLSRVTVTGGPGIPLLMETYAGTVSLKVELPRIIERVAAYIGEGELGRLTIIDAEMSNAKLLNILLTNLNTSLITVLKSPSVAKNFVALSDWQEFRERDTLREGKLVLHGEGAPIEGVKLRVVEMRRPGRHSHSTFFGVGGSTADALSTQEVAEAYLSRWPHQEQLFRNARNGLGLDRTHGYSGEMVQHLAIETKKEKAESRLRRAQERETASQETLRNAEVIAKKAHKKDKATTAALASLARVATETAKTATREAQEELDKITSTPRVIYERDTARENVVTALTMNLFLLIEFVLREYFGGLRVELRTFIEHFVYLPVTVITSSKEIRYQVEANPRHPERTEQARRACEEVTRRKLRRGSRTVVFEMVETRRKRLEVRRV